MEQKYQPLTPHKNKPGCSSSMTLNKKYKNILAVDTQSGYTPGQFLCGDRCAQFSTSCIPDSTTTIKE